MRIRNADGSGFKHRRMHVKRFIDFTQCDIFPAFDDEFLESSCDKHESVFIQVPHVSGVQPPIRFHGV